MGLETRVASDPLWALPWAFDHHAVDQQWNRLHTRFRPPSERYVCFHGSGLTDVEAAAVVDGLEALSTQTPVVVIPSELADGDESLGRLMAERGGRNIEVAGNLSVPDRVALIARSAGYIGTSPHSGVIAATYGVSPVWLRDDATTRAASGRLGGGRVFRPDRLLEAATRALDRPLDVALVESARSAAVAGLRHTAACLVGSSVQRGG
jgi:hypothetical protein